MYRNTHTDQPKPDYEKWVEQALTEPGLIHAAYGAFHDFSFGNQMLAMMQLEKPEPIASFNNWKERGRHVKKAPRASLS